MGAITKPIPFSIFLALAYLWFGGNAIVASDITAPPTDGRAAMEAVEARYSQLQTLHQRCTWIHSPVEGEAPPNYLWADLTLTSELYFKRPNRVRIISDHLDLYSNGEIMWIVDPARGEYTSGPPPEQLANTSQLILADASPILAMPNHLTMKMLFPDQPPSDCEHEVSTETIEFTLASAEHDGVTGLLISEQSDGNDHLMSSYWISSVTGLVHRWKLISESTYYGDPEDPTDDMTGHSSNVVECSLVESDADLGDDMFEFNPTPDQRQVKRLSVYLWPAEPRSMSMEERIAATVTLSEASMGPLHPERLVSDTASRTGTVGTYRKGERVDVNADGFVDLIMPAVRGEALVVDGVTGRSRVLAIKGRAAGGNISKLLPVAIDDDVVWAVASNHFDPDFEVYRVVFSLHGPDGEEWWVFSPELLDDLSSKGTLAVTDLDDDGQPEIIVGIRIHARIPIGPRSWRHEERGSLLTVLNLRGERISQIPLDGGLVDLMIGGSQFEPMIIGVLDNRVMTVKFVPPGME